jgi:arsenate reductase-like glutaredoxin family protein
MSSDEGVDEGFFRQCETGAILFKYNELLQYRLNVSYTDSVNDIEDLVNGISDLINTKNIDVKQLQNTSYLNSILKENSEKIQRPLPILTDKTNPFSFRDVIRHGGGNALKDLLNPRQRTLNQIVRLYKAEIRKKVYRKVFELKEVDISKMAYLNEETKPDFSDKIIEDFTRCIEYLKGSSEEVKVAVAAADKEPDIPPSMMASLRDLPNKLVVYPIQVLLTPIVSVMKSLHGNESYCYKVFMGHFSKTEQKKTSGLSRTVGKISKSVSRGIDTIGLPVQRILTSFFGAFNICLKMTYERELLFFSEILQDPKEIKNIQLLNGMFFLTKISEIIYSSGLCFMNSFTASGAHYAVSSSLKSMRSVFRSTKKGGKKRKYKNKTYRKKIHGGTDAATIMVLIMILLLILMLCSNNTSPCPLIFLFAFLNL